MSIMDYNSIMPEKKITEVHVKVDLELYRKVRGKIALQGITFKEWMEQKLREEVYGKLHE